MFLWCCCSKKVPHSRPDFQRHPRLGTMRQIAQGGGSTRAIMRQRFDIAFGRRCGRRRRRRRGGRGAAPDRSRCGRSRVGRRGRGGRLWSRKGHHAPRSRRCRRMGHHPGHGRGHVGVMCHSFGSRKGHHHSGMHHGHGRRCSSGRSRRGSSRCPSRRRVTGGGCRCGSRTSRCRCRRRRTCMISATDNHGDHHEHSIGSGRNRCHHGFLELGRRFFPSLLRHLQLGLKGSGFVSRPSPFLIQTLQHLNGPRNQIGSIGRCRNTTCRGRQTTGRTGSGCGCWCSSSTIARTRSRAIRIFGLFLLFLLMLLMHQTIGFDLPQDLNQFGKLSIDIGSTLFFSRSFAFRSCQDFAVFGNDSRVVGYRRSGCGRNSCRMLQGRCCGWSNCSRGRRSNRRLLLGGGFGIPDTTEQLVNIGFRQVIVKCRMVLVVMLGRQGGRSTVVRRMRIMIRRRGIQHQVRRRRGQQELFAAMKQRR